MYIILRYKSLIKIGRTTKRFSKSQASIGKNHKIFQPMICLTVSISLKDNLSNLFSDLTLPEV